MSGVFLNQLSIYFGVKPFTELELTDLAALGDLQALGIL